LIGLLSGCSSGNKFAASFGKRKYTKGYFVDNPSKVKTESRITLSENNSHEIIRGNRISPVSRTIALHNAIDTAVQKPLPVGERRHTFYRGTVQKQNATSIISNTRLLEKQVVDNAIFNMAPGDSVNAEKKKNLGKLLILLGALVLFVGLLLTVSIAIPVYYPLLLGFIFIIAGVTQLPAKGEAAPVVAQPQGNTTPPLSQAKATDLGGPAFTVSISAYIVLAIFFILVLAGGFYSLSGLLYLFIAVLLGLILSIVGAIMCLAALGSPHDIHHGLAAAGLILDFLFIIVFFSTFRL
jgi:hypothetical protein